MELDLGNVNPLFFFGKLILGMMAIVVSLNWWVHMYQSLLLFSKGDYLVKELYNITLKGLTPSYIVLYLQF